MRLYHWDGVLKDHTLGGAVAMATSEEEARRLVLASLKQVEWLHYTIDLTLDDPRWDAKDAEAADWGISSVWFESRDIVMGPPTAVYDVPVALCFSGGS